MNILTPSHNTIHWRQVLSLMALDLAIIISWIAYNKYQPALLDQFQFQEFALPLAVLQGLILFITPPIAGLLADRLIRKGGNRLPVITIGINFVSMVFMVVALTVFANPDGFIRLLFPVMIALWLISMNIFHSPAMSTVEMFVPARKLPQVVAIFAVISELAQSIEPSIIEMIEFFGGPLTFAVGGLLVFGTGFWFTRATRNLQAATAGDAADSAYDVEKSNFVLVFVLGAILGVLTMFFYEIFPTWGETRVSWVQNGTLSGGAFTSLLIAGAALVSYPLGLLVERLGTFKMVALGSLASSLLLLGIWQLTGGISTVLFFLFPITFALTAVSALPIAFLSLERRHKVFGIGLFFSGVELANSTIDVLQVL